MPVLHRFAARILLAFLMGVSLHVAAQGQNTQLAITSASVDTNLTTVTVFGRNFTRFPGLQATLSGFGSPLTISSMTDTTVMALLPPGIAPGSYWLTLATGNSGNNDRIAITMGIQGLRGSITGLSGLPCVWNNLPSVIAVDVALDGHMTLTCTPWPPGSVPQGTYDPLPITSATVRSALDLDTGTSNFEVPALCGVVPAINCPGGLPIPTQMHLEQQSVTITQATGTTFNFTVQERLTTLTDIQVSLPGTSCSFNLDTARSNAPTMTVTGTAVFDSNPPPDPPNRVRFINVNVFGIDPSDLVFSGAATCVSLAPQLGPFIINGLEQQFSTRFSSQCGAPGAALLTPCQ
jgi:hypothetical protein